MLVTYSGMEASLRYLFLGEGNGLNSNFTAFAWEVNIGHIQVKPKKNQAVFLC